MRHSVLELEVRNHPGVMSHVAGLFARRAFNIEGILCGPMDDERFSRIYLLVHAEVRMDQLVKQLEKLHDVLRVNARPDYDQTVFRRLHEFVEIDGPLTPERCVAGDSH